MRSIVIAWLFLLMLTTASAAERPEKPKLQLMNAGAIAGLMHGQESVWGTMRAQVKNRSDRAVQAKYALHFTDMPTVQFVMPLWLPPKSDRRLYLPVRPPQNRKAETGLRMLISGWVPDYFRIVKFHLSPVGSFG